MHLEIAIIQFILKLDRAHQLGYYTNISFNSKCMDGFLRARDYLVLYLLISRKLGPQKFDPND